MPTVRRWAVYRSRFGPSATEAWVIDSTTCRQTCPACSLMAQTVPWSYAAQPWRTPRASIPRGHVINASFNSSTSSFGCGGFCLSAPPHTPLAQCDFPSHCPPSYSSSISDPSWHTPSYHPLSPLARPWRPKEVCSWSLYWEGGMYYKPANSVETASEQRRNSVTTAF